MSSYRAVVLVSAPLLPASTQQEVLPHAECGSADSSVAMRLNDEAHTLLLLAQNS